MKTTCLIFSFMYKEANAAYEFQDAVSAAGIQNVKVNPPQAPGILVAEIEGERDELVSALTHESWRFNNLLKVSFISAQIRISETTQQTLQQVCEELDRVVGGKPYRITVRKVRSEDFKKKLISDVADRINAPVDLENYSVDITVYRVGDSLYFVANSLTDEFPVEKFRQSQSLENRAEFTRESSTR
ncbi:MAG: hypothetical protein QW767_01100 [Thermoprotei archaeon]